MAKNRFRSRAECIIDQYSSYVLEDIKTNVNGKMTQGEFGYANLEALF